MHVLDGAALGDDPGAAEFQGEVLDVEAEDFLGAGRRVVQEPPQHPWHPFPQGVRGVGEQLVQPGGRDGAVIAPGGLAPHPAL
ncbi:hypothetical protein J2S55_008386 [Streptosporangium brasiliense]|uniref:Uncharacterized protein n=1 Tax=Streptosporangium brasiliense TaxID=47480 RepID=A0ABT9RLF1_9ACTN|nr:hypothetical protein [Streptosporangium brasiliense]